MTLNFNSSNDSRQLVPNRSHPHPASLEDATSETPSPLDNLKRDRFELLSAYLDGEITAAERHQVEEWLKTDPQIQCLYARLIQIRRSMNAASLHPLSTPSSADQTVDRVFSRIDRRPQRAFVWGGMAVAALVISVFSGNLQVRYATNQIGHPDDSLAISLEEPLVANKAATIAPNVPSTALMISLDQPLMTASDDLAASPLDGAAVHSKDAADSDDTL